MPLIDANVILRYLLKDHPGMSEVAKETILAGAQTTAEVLAEVVYVLKSVYHADRSAIAETMEVFIQEITIPNRLAITYAFRLYGKTSLDFVDCLLAGYHHMNGEEIVTFDEKLHKLSSKIKFRNKLRMEWNG